MNIRPIMSLSPYIRGKWAIKIMLIRMGDEKHYVSKRFGPGKLLNLDLKEIEGDDVIRLTLFNNVVDQYVGRLNIGCIYYVANCTIKRKNVFFNSTKGSNYELTLSEDCQGKIIEALPALYERQDLSVTFITCEQAFAGRTIGDIVENLIGVVSYFGPCEPLSKGFGGHHYYTKREIRITDETGTITIMLWNTDTNSIQIEETGVNIIMISGGVLYQYANMIHLIKGNIGSIHVNPNTERSACLRQWWLKNSIVPFEVFRVFGLPKFQSLFQFKRESIEEGEKFCRFKGIITAVRVKGGKKKSTLTYVSCTNCNSSIPECFRDESFCKICIKKVDATHGLKIDILVRTPFAKCFVSAINVQAEVLLGLSVDQVLSENIQETDITSRLMFKTFDFCVGKKKGNRYFYSRREVEIYDKYIIKSIQKVNHKSYNNYLIEEIKKMTGVE